MQTRIALRAMLTNMGRPAGDAVRYLNSVFLVYFPIGIRLRGQEVKTSPFHGGNTGSIPVGVTAFLVWTLSSVG